MALWQLSNVETHVWMKYIESTNIKFQRSLYCFIRCTIQFLGTQTYYILIQCDARRRAEMRFRVVRSLFVQAYIRRQTSDNTEGPGNICVFESENEISYCRIIYVVYFKY